MIFKVVIFKKAVHVIAKISLLVTLNLIFNYVEF